VAASPSSTVLITGENGTGKDLAAKVVHGSSARAARAFMNITCSALPEALLESELFGHERGAFTDARQQKKGLLELADGGTVFLDEIGEMSLGLQAKLLRFLEEKAFRRVGGTRDTRVDVRVVAATNRDQRRAVKEGRFREDLFYRLQVLEVELPPLRERSGTSRCRPIGSWSATATSSERPSPASLPTQNRVPQPVIAEPPAPAAQ
jgi:transcriptional regulator with PAS, ATPase and Fis domain